MVDCVCRKPSLDRVQVKLAGSGFPFALHGTDNGWFSLTVWSGNASTSGSAVEIHFHSSTFAI